MIGFLPPIIAFAILILAIVLDEVVLNTKPCLAHDGQQCQRRLNHRGDHRYEDKYVIHTWSDSLASLVESDTFKMHAWHEIRNIEQSAGIELTSSGDFQLCPLPKPKIKARPQYDEQWIKSEIDRLTKVRWEEKRIRSWKTEASGWQVTWDTGPR